jgi:hypothetical protein
MSRFADVLNRLALFSLVLVGSLSWSSLPGHAQPMQTQVLPKPSGKVILTVSGKITVTNGDGTASFDRQMIESLGLRTLRTTTTWTDGVKVFEGVPARELLKRVGAAGKLVAASALNDYTVEIPASDFETYDVLLALRMNGQDLKLSDKGPIWIVYPRDDHAEIRNATHYSRWIWQLKSLKVQ